MRILSIQSSVSYGHVGNSAAVFPLQRIGVDHAQGYAVARPLPLGECLGQAGPPVDGAALPGTRRAA